MKKTRTMSIALTMLLITSAPVIAADLLVDGPNARINAIDSNWANEGRFAVHVVGGTPGSPCGGWIHFSQAFFSNPDFFKTTLATALTAFAMGKRIAIYGVNSQCWTGINIQVFSD